jgi:hypothetical protein
VDNLERRRRRYVFVTPLEQRAAKALVNCRMQPASRDKYFARWVSIVAAESPERDLSEGARWVLWKLVWRFRRQIHCAALLKAAAAGGEPRETVEKTLMQPSLPLSLEQKDGR